MLKRIEDDGSRGATNIYYTGAPQVSNAVLPSENKYPNIANAAPRPLVYWICHDDSLGQQLGHPVNYQYIYYNGTTHTGTSDQRTNLGFDWIEKKEVNSGYTVRTYYYKNDTNPLYLDFRSLVPRIEIYGRNHVLYLAKDCLYYSRTTVNNDNTSNPQLPSAKFVYKSDEYTYNYNGEGMSNPITYHISYDYDEHGNLKRKTDEGDNSVTTDTGEYIAVYDYYTANNLSQLHTEQTYGYLLSSGQKDLISETNYFYNSNFLPDHKVMENGADSVTISHGYDDYGNVTRITDGRLHDTVLQYDPNYQTYIRYKTNPKGQIEETHYDNLMNPDQTIDINGVVWQTIYDVFSRKKKEIASGDDVNNPTTRITYPDDDEFLVGGKPGFPNRLRIEKKIKGANYLEYDTYYDGLMNVFQKKTKAQNGWKTFDFFYDYSGRLSKTSVPYFTASSANSAPDCTVKTTWLEYDPINRISVTHNPDTTVTQTYYGKQEIKTVDRNGHVTSKIITGNIALGQRIDGTLGPQTPVLNAGSIVRFSGTYPSQTEYSRMKTATYGDVIQTIDTDDRVLTEDRFDALGRKVSSVSPLNGTWTYGYDGNNNLTSLIDAKNQTIIMKYDELNRIYEKEYPDGSKVNYYYDENGYGYSKNRLTRMVYPGGQESYTYDARGRITAMTQTIDGISKTKYMSYNSMDQIDTITYPDGEVVTYGYDQGGMANGLSGNSTYVSAINYAPFNRMNSMVYGNGIETYYEYYDTASEYDSTAGTYYSYRLRQIRVSKSGGSFWNLTYQYDKTGNVKVKTDTVNSNFSENYTYDDLNRLTNASSVLSGSRSFGYDELDNITQKDGRSYQYDPLNPYKLTGDGRYTYTYDANGNTTGRSDGRTIAWDYENRVTSVSDDGSYTYNGNGQRIKKTCGVTRYYFFPEYEEEWQAGIKTNAVKYYFVNYQRVAESSSANGLRYYVKDHLGSASVITDSIGVVKLTKVYQPYGSEAYSQGSPEVTYKFTDKERDNSGLIYFGARFYDPEVGRFISPDPIRDGGNWYAYCYDNPVRYIDLFGLDVGVPGVISGHGENSGYNVTETVTHNSDGSFSTTYTTHSSDGNSSQSTYGFNSNGRITNVNNSTTTYNKDGSYRVSTTTTYLNSNGDVVWGEKEDKYYDKYGQWSYSFCTNFMNVNWNAVVAGLNKTINGGFWIFASITGEVETWGFGTNIAGPAFLYGTYQAGSGLKEICDGLNGGRSIAENYGEFNDYLLSRPADPFTMAQP